jgi:hypothetical protein
MKAMLLSKLKITACAAALMLAAGIGATGLTYRATAQQPTASTNRPQADDLEALRLEIEALRKSLQATRERVKTLEGEVSALKGHSHGPQGTAPSGGTMPAGPTSASTQGGGPSGGISGSGPAAPAAGGASGGMSGGGPQGPAAGGDVFQPQGNMQHQMMQPRERMMGVAGGGSMMPKMMQGGSMGGRMMQGRGHGMGQGAGGGTTASNPFGADKAGSAGSKKPETTTDPVNDAAAALEFLKAHPDNKQAIESLERALKKLKEREKPKGPDQGHPGETKRDE